jgi:hypothetical protein
MWARLLAMIGTLVVAMSVAAPVLADFGNGPDDSGVVSRGEYPFGLAFIDPDAGLVALGGPPPEQGCVGEGFEDADFLIVETPAGAVKILVHDVEPFFIYEATSIPEICEAVFTTGIDPIAVGADIAVRYNENGNYLGGNANGVVYDDDGKAWSFHGNSKIFIAQNGDLEIRETVKLHSLGS